MTKHVAQKSLADATVHVAPVINETMQKLYAAQNNAFDSLIEGDGYGFCEEWDNIMDMKGYDFESFRVKAAERGITVTEDGHYHLAH